MIDDRLNGIAEPLDMKRFSIIVKGYHTDERLIAFHHACNRIKFWDRHGAFRGGLGSLMCGKARKL